MAMLPLAPARLSITTAWPVLAVICAPRMRAARSVTPPAEVETMSLIGLAGYPCAKARLGRAAMARMATARTAFIVTSLQFRGNLSKRRPIARILRADQHGRHRQIRLRRADPVLGSLSRPGEVAGIDRNLRPRRRDLGILVQRQLPRFRRPLPPGVRRRPALQAPDLSVG